MIEEDRIIHQLQGHYASPGLSDRVLSILAAAGKDLHHLTIEDLATIDELHTRGHQATVELAGRLQLQPYEKVLDVGSGLGGPARYLAATYDCQVTGIDATEEFCQTAQMLADRVGLGDRVVFKQGSALHMPFGGDTFDVVWTQHAQMNIPEKPQLYRNIHRVLRYGGWFAMYDILAGSGGPPIFPVPWASVPEYSFLISPDELQALLKGIGFQSLHWQDVTESGLAFTHNNLAKMRQKGSASMGNHVFMGPDYRSMMENMVRNFEEDRLRVVEAVWQKV